jgi:hypothetical protein
MQLPDLTRISLTYPRTVLALIAAISIALAPGLAKVKPAYGYRVLIGNEHPAIRTLTEMTERFGGGLSVLVGWTCDDTDFCREVLDANSLLMADAITRSLEGVSGIRIVDGPANSPILVPSEDGFAVRTLVEDGRIVDDVDELIARVRGDPSWVGRLLSANGRVAAIELQARDIQDATSEAIVTALEEALVPYETKGVRFYPLGDSVDVVIGGRALSESSARLVPFTVAAIAIVLLMMSRSWHESMIAVATMGVAYLWTFGALGWLGWPKDGILEVLAPLILVIGVCDSMHFLARESDVRQFGSGGAARRDSLLHASRAVVAPCLLTSLTTAAAFASFTLSDLDTFDRFGSIASLAVMLCFVLTFSLLPILASVTTSYFPRMRPARSWSSLFDRVTDLSEQRAGVALVGCAVVLIVFGYGWVAKLSFDTNWLESWGEKSRLVQSVRFFTGAGMHSESLEVQIDLPDSLALFQPGTLESIERCEERLKEIRQVVQLQSVLTFIRRVNRMFNGDDPAFERLADTPEGNAELLELISMSESELLRTWISSDNKSLRLSLKIQSEETLAASEALISDVVERISMSIPETWQTHISGDVAVQRDWVRDVQQTQFRSFPSSFGLVFVMLVVFFRSLTLAAAATVPTLLPVVATLGGMGWIGMSLDISRTMIAAIIVGIGVDHSIHLLHEYQLRTGRGESASDAMRGALIETGRPIVITTIALALGFLTLLASAWQTISSFGFLVAISMVGAMLSTIFVVPALIFWVSRLSGAARS